MSNIFKSKILLLVFSVQLVIRRIWNCKAMSFVNKTWFFSLVLFFCQGLTYLFFPFLSLSKFLKVSNCKILYNFFTRNLLLNIIHNLNSLYLFLVHLLFSAQPLDITTQLSPLFALLGYRNLHLSLCYTSIDLYYFSDLIF